MLIDSIIGRVSTDLKLAPLYDAMVRAAMQVTVDRLRDLYVLDHMPPSQAVQRAHRIAFATARNAFLDACRAQGLIDATPHLAASDVARYVLSAIVLA